MERYSDAIADYTRAIELDSEDEWAITNRGGARLLTRNYTQAIQDFNRSLELDANSYITLGLRSVAYRAIHQNENAESDIEQAIKIAQKDYDANPLNHFNIFNLAICHLAAGDVAQAKHLCQDALEKDPPVRYIEDAIRKLEGLLIVLPNFPNAQDLCSYLKSFLAEASQ